jgi:hypothetical protein
MYPERGKADDANGRNLPVVKQSHVAWHAMPLRKTSSGAGYFVGALRATPLGMLKINNCCVVFVHLPVRLPVPVIVFVP